MPTTVSFYPWILTSFIIFIYWRLTFKFQLSRTRHRISWKWSAPVTFSIFSATPFENETPDRSIGKWARSHSNHPVSNRWKLHRWYRFSLTHRFFTPNANQALEAFQEIDEIRANIRTIRRNNQLNAIASGHQKTRRRNANVSQARRWAWSFRCAPVNDRQLAHNRGFKAVPTSASCHDRSCSYSHQHQQQQQQHAHRDAPYLRNSFSHSTNNERNERNSEFMHWSLLSRTWPAYLQTYYGNSQPTARGSITRQYSVQCCWRHAKRQLSVVVLQTSRS